jgi:hypothetical protein
MEKFEEFAAEHLVISFLACANIGAWLAVIAFVLFY